MTTTMTTTHLPKKRKMIQDAHEEHHQKHQKHLMKKRDHHQVHQKHLKHQMQMQIPQLLRMMKRTKK